MTDINAIKTFNIEATEYGYNLAYASYNASSFKVNIPKLMPLIPVAPPLVTPKMYNPKIFCNDISNMPVGGMVINTQNYLTINVNRNSDTYNRGGTDGGTGYMTRVNCRILNNNIRNIYITNVL
ncbi:MAG: hypothetical protein PHF63_00190 [Herbinix sp.]|nr:hypothetical protein [Herbinix sp.]